MGKLKSRYQWDGGELYDLYKAALVKAGRCPNCAALLLPQTEKTGFRAKNQHLPGSVPKRKKISR